ncbi:MAG: LacI family DNA-binding transcriptional regulator [Spirochaetaceae bacterium]|nr:LacI family DNA-binding transcriptional regulator [Spirochaetaceae bacterium]
MKSTEVSMKDVAKLAEVSTATVSNVINETCKVNEKTKTKVNEAIKALNYTVNSTARRLRTGQSKIVGFVVSNLAHYFYQEIGSIIEEVLNKNGYELFYINSHEDPIKEAQQLDLCNLEDFAGIIVVPVNNDWKKLESKLINMPVVFIDRKPINIRRDVVLITNTKSSFNLTNILIHKGAKKIAFVAPKLDNTMQLRLDGFKDAILQNGLSVDEDCIIFGHNKPKTYGELVADNEWEGIFDYLIYEKKVDCIISGNALFAFGAVSYFRKKRIKLQQDILFGTFDNAFWMKNLDEEIIVVEQNTKAMGEKAANILLKRLNGESFIYDDYCIETKLLIINENE